jgi:hypothetical protein
MDESEFNSQNVPNSELPVIGFDGTGTPDTGRITVKLTVNSAIATAIFPYDVAGTTSVPTGFYGAVTGAKAGAVKITTTSTSGSSPLARGAFGSTIKYPTSPRVQSTFEITPTDGGATRSAIRNGAWSYSGGIAQSFAVLLETPPGNTTTSTSWTRSGDNGLRMISLPLYPYESDEAKVLGVDATKLLLGRYRPNLSPKGYSSEGLTYGVTADKYELYPNISEPFAPGRGYWLKLNTNLTTTVRGGAPPSNVPFEIPLLGGWNQIGIPFNSAFQLASVKVVSGSGAAQTFDQAVRNGILLPGVYRWLLAGGYSRVDIGTIENQKLLPFEGYFIWSRVARGVRLIFDPSVAADKVRFAKVSTTNWRLPINVETTTAADRDAAFGVTEWTGTKALRTPASKPPVPARTLSLSFASSGNLGLDDSQAGNAAGWSDSLGTMSAKGTSWEFIVDGAWPGESVLLTWATVATLPQKLNITLIDLDGGQRTEMALTKRYRFTTDGSARHFRIEAAPRNTPLRSLHVSVLTPSRAVQLTGSFGTTGKASLTIEDSKGTLLRTLAVNQSVPAGLIQWVWDCRDTAGNEVPAGSYVARLRFTDNWGEPNGKATKFELP